MKHRYLTSLLVVLLLIPATAFAQTKVYVDADATGANNGDSWADAYTFLQDALDEVNANPGTDFEIWVAEGTYLPDQDQDGDHTSGSRSESFRLTRDGVEVYGGFSGTETTRSEREVVANPVILSGDIGTAGSTGDNSYHVWFLDGGQAANITDATVIDGFTIAAGRATGTTAPNREGGGLYCDGSGSGNTCTPILRNLVLRNNQAIDFGGAVVSKGNGGTASPTIVDVVFAENSASTIGGALYNDGQENGEASPTIVNTLFVDNTSPGGGAMYNDGPNGVSSPTIINSIFFSNGASTNGGAIYNNGSVGTASPEIANTIFWENTASNKGNQIYNLNAGAQPSIRASLVENGTSGIFDDGGSTSYAASNVDQDPLFVDSQNPAGADGQYATNDDGLRSSRVSPITDAGDTTPFETGGQVEEITSDLRGVSRVADDDGDGTAVVDIGAYESGLVSPDISLEATSSVPEVRVGEQTTVTITAENVGDVDASGVSVTVTIPSSLSLVSSSGDGSYGSGTWNVGSLGEGSDAVLDLTLERTSEGGAPQVASELSAIDAPGDPNSTNDQARAVVSSFPYGSGRSAAFDGISDFAEVPDDPALDLTGNFTISFWMKVDSDGFNDTDEVLLAKGGDTWTVRRSGSSSSLAFVTFHGSGARATLDGDVAVDDGRWHHVAVVYDRQSGVKRLYIDGVLDQSASESRDVRTSSEALFIGVEPGPTGGLEFGGELDQIQIWDVALTTKEVRKRAKRTADLSGTVAQDLIAAYRFDTDGTGVVYDLASADGRLQNGTVDRASQITSFSGAPFGRQSDVVGGGEGTTIGPTGGSVTASNVQTSGSSALQVYQYGRTDGPIFTGSDPAEDFSQITDDVSKRLHVVWGVTAVGSDVTADVTFDYSNVQGLTETSNVRLLKRSGPGDPWQDVSDAWTWNTSAQTFSRSGVSSFSQYAIGEASTPLPVEFASFRGIALDNAAKLEWTTATEQNNAGFQVQRKVDGSFQNIDGAFVEGAGTAEEPQSYSYRVEDLDAGQHTFRLKQVDVDGGSSFSKETTVKVGLDSQYELQAYPNPISEQATIKFAVKESQDVTLELYNTLGQRVQVLHQGAVPSSQTRTVSLQASDLSSGLYIVRMRGESFSTTKSVTVVR